MFCRYMTTDRRVENEIMVKRKEKRLLQALSLAVFTEECWLGGLTVLQGQYAGFAAHRDDEKSDLP